MITNNDFITIMNTQGEMALATSIEGQPNVRIVNFYFDSATNTVFFTTFEDNIKVQEFKENTNVAFTTIPHQGNAHVKAKGSVQRSKRTIGEIADGFIAKIPDYKETLEQVGEYLILFEIRFSKATVTLDFENIETITINEIVK